MNTIYRIVWNAATGKWVVASELAKGRKKSSTKSIASVMLLAGLVGGMSLADRAEAAEVTLNPTATASCGVPGSLLNPAWTGGDVCGTAAGENAVGNLGGSAFGDTAVTSGFFGTALGAYSFAGNHSTAIGASAMATGSDSLAAGYNSQSFAANSTAIGTNAAAGSATTGNVRGTTAIGWAATADGGTTPGAWSGTAVGTHTIAVGDGATAFGDSATANADRTAAFGRNAQATATQATAFGAGTVANQSAATAIGYNAQVTAQNATAIGANSVANRANTVSVGSVGNERNIVNVEAGVANTDAVNVSQLKPVVAGLGGGASIDPTTGVVTGPTYNVQGGTQTNVGAALDALDSGVNNRVAYDQNADDSTNYNSVTMGNGQSTGPVAIHNVAPGALSATSTDAVNGSQLFATNQQVGQNTSDITNLGNRVTTNEGNITNLQGQMADAVMYDDSSHGSVTLGGTSATAPVGLHNVAAGTANTDAVNVSQLAPVVAGLGGGASINPTTGAVTGPTYNVQGGTQTNVGAALDALDSGVNNRVAYDQNADGSTNYNSVTMGNGQSTGPVAIHNVAPGELSGTSTDAVNGSQLFATNQQMGQNTSDITNLGNRVTTNEGNITTLQGQMADAVMYDDSTHGSVTLGGTSATAPVALHNVAPGELSGTSTDAVNGSQLFATNQQVGQNTTDITNLQNNFDNGTIGLVQQDATTGNITVAAGKNGSVVDFTGTEGARQLTGVAPGELSGTSTDAVNGSQLFATNQQVAQNTGDITNLDGRVTTNEGNISTLQGQMADAVMYDDSTHGSVTLGGTSATAPVALHNVAAGELSATSTDAVNGSQLFATNQQVSQNTTDITNLNSQIGNGTVGLVQQASAGANLTVGKDTDGVAVDFADKDGNTRTLSNITAGIANTDAVNVSQLKGVTDALGGGASIDPTTGAVTPPSYTVQKNTYNNVGDAIGAIDGDVTNLYTQLGNGSVGLVQQAAPGANLTVGKDTDGTAVDFADKDGNTRTLSNVTAGTADTDAVNVSQLKSSGLIDANGNAIAAVTYDQNADGTPNYNSVTMGGGKSDGPVTIKNVAAGTEDTDAVNVGQLKSAGLVDNNGNTMDAVVYDPGSNRGQVTLGGVGAAAPVVLTNVANGVNQYDAVNFGQLSGLQSDLQNQINTVNGQVTNIDNRVTSLENNGGGNGGGTPAYVAANASAQPAAGANVGDTTGVALGYNTAATGDSASAVGDSAQATGDNSTAVGSSAVASNAGGTALGSSATVNANNGVAVGNNATVAASASNGTAVGSGSSVSAASGTAVGQGASVASTATNSVALGAGSVATQANSVSVGSAGNERTITNVAAGVNATDAVNVGQLQSAQNWAQSYTDQKVGQLNSRITAVGQHADAGTAAAMAMSNIPQAYQPNQSSLGAGVGTFNGQAAVAVGMSTITPNGRWVLKGSLTGNSQGDVGVGFGASMVW